MRKVQPTRIGAIILVLLGGVFLFVRLSGQESSVAAVQRDVSIFRSVIETHLAVDEPLARSQRELAILARTYPRLSRTWQLEPQLANAIEEEELVAYLISRANTYLVLSAALLSRVPFDTTRGEGGTMDRESQVMKEISSEAWGSTASESVFLSQTGTYLTDKAGNPKRLAHRNDLQDYWRLYRAFRPDLKRRLLEARFSRDDTYIKNIKYLERQYGAEPQEVLWLRKTPGLPPEARFYSANVANMTVFAQHVAGEAKIVFVAPLSQ